jgi:hypothetical protein
MEHKQTTFLLVAMLLLTLSVSKSFPHNNDLPAFNALLVNERVITSSEMASTSMGKLSFLSVNPGAKCGEKIAFFAYLRRQGKIVNADWYSHNRAVKEIEISEILKLARVGDELVIDPVTKRNGATQQSIYLKQGNLPVQFQWLFQVNKRNEGC